MNKPIVNKQNFHDAFIIQARVINAVFKRELLALSGRSGVGFAMVLLEPVVFVIAVSVIMYIRRHGITNVPVVAFAMSGYCIMWAIRFQLMRNVSVVPMNIPLMYHRQVKIIDLMFGRAVILVVTTSISFLLFIPLILFGIIDFPNEPCLVVGSWFLVLWYAVMVGFVNATIQVMYKIGPKLVLIIVIVHVWITGAFFMVEWFSPEYQEILLYLPLVNATEMMRDGLFGNIATTHYSIPYIILWNIIVTYIGLAFVRKLSLRGAINDDSD